MIVIILIIAAIGLIVAAFIYIPKYLDEEQRIRDNSNFCRQYREFLQTAENWNEIGDSVQAKGVYNIAIDLFRKGQCTRIH